LCGWAIWAYRSADYRFAVGSCILFSFALPTWIGITFFGLPFDFRVLAAIIVLSLVCVWHRETFKSGLLPGGFGRTDWAVLSLVAVHCLSDWWHGGQLLLVPARAYGEWLLAYFGGRFSCLGLNDLRRLAPIAIGVSTFLAGTACIEATTRVNLFEVVAGERPVELAPRHTERLGLKRAFGPVKHSIFLGMILLLLLPWHALGMGAGQSRSQWLGRWLAVALTPLAILGTGSRAAILGVLSIGAGAAAILRPRYRMIVGAGALLLVLLGFMYRAELANAIDRYTQESRRLLHFSITIDGVELPFTGTMNRLYIFRLYRPAVMQAGLLGYGTERTSHFPMDVPIAPENKPALEEMPTIENAYLLLLLRFGWLGLLAFVAVVVEFNICAISLAKSFHRFAAGDYFSISAIALFCVSLLLCTVWMAHDFGFTLLWTGGVLASLWRFRQKNLEPF
jgi:hypothetical protein